MTSTQPNPRRRYLSTTSSTKTCHTVLPAADVPSPSSSSSTDCALPRSSTFHCPKSPALEDDPIINIPLLPKRSPTSARDLKDAIDAGDDRIAQILGAVDRSLSGQDSFLSVGDSTLRTEDPPVPRFMLLNPSNRLNTQSRSRPPITSPPGAGQCLPARKHHTSDSGIGSTISSSEKTLPDDQAGIKHLKHRSTASGNMHVRRPLEEGRVRSGINGASNAGSVTGTQHILSEQACRQIQKFIILPIIREEKLKDFHSLVNGLPYRVARKEITCLRDLEKVLLWLAPKWSTSTKAFLNFCETSIQCIHTTVEYLNDHDQRRPADRPYNNGYFLDLVEQVRQYAATIASSRATMSSEREENHEELGLRGGLSQTGRPVELIRIKDGQSVSLRTGKVVDRDSPSIHGNKRSASEETDEDVLRSMARRRKNALPTMKEAQRCSECDKEFKRPCDLTKHEKTHSRPWKCTDRACRFYDVGWPTEKERDRHVNDRHSDAPTKYRCHYHPCPYESKRKSNCKQHMEKAHGWAYVRAKSNGKDTKRSQQSATPSSSSYPTPMSRNVDDLTPDMSDIHTPQGLYQSHSRNSSVVPSESSDLFLVNPPQTDDTLSGFNPSFSWLANTTPFTPVGSSDYTHNSHRPSWDASVADATTDLSSLEAAMGTPHDEEPLFGDTFDWSNMGDGYTSYNVQLTTPATSVNNYDLNDFERNSSITNTQHPGSGQCPSLSSGAQADIMLYSPYSANPNESPVDEGVDFNLDPRSGPTRDFPLFDSSPTASALTGRGGNQTMFEDLASFDVVSTGWSGTGTDLARQFEMDFMDHE